MIHRITDQKRKLLNRLSLLLLAAWLPGSSGHAQDPLTIDSLYTPRSDSISVIDIHTDPSPFADYTYSPRVDYWRLAAVSALSASTLGISYMFLRRTWWSDRAVAFHFDEGRDLRYSLNMDKVAHFYGGAIGTDLFYLGLRWAKMSEKGAYLYGAALSSFVQIAMEMKDAYSPRWGFSVVDVSTGILGTFFPIGQRYVPWLRDFDVKLSYYRPSGHYFEVVNPAGATYNDDYEGQTYWLAYKVNNLLPSALEKIWPDILGIAIGFSLDTNSDGNGGGDIEVFLGLDYDLTALFPSDNPFWEGVKHYLNYIHLPAPAVRLTPSVIWFGLYF